MKKFFFAVLVAVLFSGCASTQEDSNAPEVSEKTNLVAHFEKGLYEGTTNIHPFIVKEFFNETKNLDFWISISQGNANKTFVLGPGEKSRDTLSGAIKPSIVVGYYNTPPRRTTGGLAYRYAKGEKWYMLCNGNKERFMYMRFDEQVAVVLEPKQCSEWYKAPKGAHAQVGYVN